MDNGENNWEGKSILVVEDEPMTYKLIQVMLSKTGVNLIKAEDGQTAVSICKKDKNISLVLMDIGLPKMNGYDATRHIKKINPNLPIVAQTAYVMKDHKRMCFEAGCDEYLAKPYSSTDLIKKIKKFF